MPSASVFTKVIIMKTGRSMTDLAQEIDRQQIAKRDFIADTRQVRVLDDGMTIAVENQGAFRMTDHALGQVGERTGIPLKYLRLMQHEAPALLAENVNHWFMEAPERRMLRTLDGTARAFLSDRYQRIDNADVVAMTLPVLATVPGIKIISAEITESRLYVKAATSLITGEVKSRRVGDIVEAGVVISNSEIGVGAVSIAPFAHFLACTNGMVREGGKRWAHLGRVADPSDDVYEMLTDETRRADDQALLLKVRDTLAASLDSERFAAWLEKLQTTTEQRLEGDPVKAIEVLGQKLSLNLEERATVLRNLIDGGDLSRFGVINAVTRTAESVASYDRASDFEAFGGVVLNLPANEWRELQAAA
jgi:hypothetical protein